MTVSIRNRLIPHPDVTNVKSLITINLNQYTCRNCGDSADCTPLVITPATHPDNAGEYITEDWDIPRDWIFFRAGYGGQGPPGRRWRPNLWQMCRKDGRDVSKTRPAHQQRGESAVRETALAILEIVWVIGIALMSTSWLVYGALVGDSEQVRDGLILGTIFVTYTSVKRKNKEP